MNTEQASKNILCTGMGAQTLTSKNISHVFCLFVCLFFPAVFQQKYAEVAISDFTMDLIISKRLRRQKSKCKQKRKTMKQKQVKAREETVYKSFCVFKYERNHTVNSLHFNVSPSALLDVYFLFGSLCSSNNFIAI